MEQEYEEVEIFDTTCRDGEQSTDGFREGIESKLLITKKLAELGVSTIEAGFPKSSEGDFKAMQRIAREIQGPYICALARCVKDDIDKAWKAVEDNEKPTLHAFTFMVDPESLSAYGKEDFKEIIRQSVEAVEYSKELMQGKGRVEFSAQNATIGNREQIFELYSKAIKAGADVVNLPDTSGYSLPFEIFDFVTAFMKSVAHSDQAIISTHCHNDLGNASANSAAAVRAGARQVECTINGIGERAGNAALEEVVMNIITRRKDLGVDTKIKTEILGEISWLVSDHSGYIVQPNKAIVGANAFRHSSGIHQDGVAKGAQYEIMDPKSVGWIGESFEITARSGKAGYMLRLERLGYKKETIQPEIDGIVRKGKRLSDEKGKLNDIDLRWITDEKIDPVKQKIVYKGKKLRTENGSYIAEITLEIDGKEIAQKAEHSDGAVNALFSAVDSAIGFKVPGLILYEPKNIDKGHEATAEVTIVLSDNGSKGCGIDEPIYIGRARDKDTLEASVKSYVHAINRNLTAQKQQV
jgi:2-isopropylmalate synthase